ncbi:MAG: hypothetical protein IJK01_01885 [Clostridia bacterium]|nr:hypothetical protein [Clostridia bacterium]
MKRSYLFAILLCMVLLLEIGCSCTCAVQETKESTIPTETEVPMAKETVTSQIDKPTEIPIETEEPLPSATLEPTPVPEYELDTSEEEACLHKMLIGTELDGEIVYVCEACGKEFFSDQINPEGKEHTYRQVAYQPSTCIEKGHAEYECTNCEAHVTVTLEKSAHKEAVDPAKPATCKDRGLTEGRHCTVCGKVLVKQQRTAYAEHSYRDGKCIWCGKAAQGEEADWNGGYELPDIPIP